MLITIQMETRTADGVLALCGPSHSIAPNAKLGPRLAFLPLAVLVFQISRNQTRTAAGLFAPRGPSFSNSKFPETRLGPQPAFLPLAVLVSQISRNQTRTAVGLFAFRGPSFPRFTRKLPGIPPQRVIPLTPAPPTPNAPRRWPFRRSEGPAPSCPLYR